MIEGTQGQDERVPQSQSQNNKKTIKTVTIAIIIVIIAIVVAPSLSQWYHGVPTVERSTVTTAKVFIGELVRDVEVSGRIVAAQAPQLYAPEAGQVTILAKPGSMVVKEDIVARLDSPELMALLIQERGHFNTLRIEVSRGILVDDETQLDLERSLDTARVKLNASKRERKRAEISYKREVISEMDFALSKDKLLEAELLFKHAQKRVELAKKRLDFERQTRELALESQRQTITELERRQSELEIRAPVDGVIGNWLVSQKEIVADATALMTVVDLSQYEAEINVPEMYADDLGIGLVVHMNLSGKSLSGQVSSVSPEIKNNQLTVNVSITNDSNVSLRQHQRLNARIEFERKNSTLLITRGAFLQSTAGRSAFFVTTDDTAIRKPIQTGIASVEYMELISGASEGDTLIISDYGGFSEEQQIKLTN